MEERLALVCLRKVRKSYGGKLVLDGLDLDVEERARVGVFGEPGASALLEMLAGVEAADSGDVEFRRSASSAYLPRSVGGDLKTPLETARASRPDLQSLENEMRRCARLAGSSEEAKDMALAFVEQENLLRSFRELGGPAFEGEARSLLSELAGLDRAAMSRPTRGMSEGRRKLVALAACLMKRPDLLVLDEPEANLDPESRERLEGCINRFDGAIVVASRDRSFLKRVCERVFEVRDGGISSREDSSNVVDLGSRRK